MDIYILADRVRKLAASRSLNRDKAGLLTFTFGAIYSLGQAFANGGVRNPTGHVDSWEERVRDAKELAGGMAAKRNIPTVDKKNRLWVAGFHLNNALLRIDAGFERVCRYWAKIPRSKVLDRVELERRAIDKNLDKSFLKPWLRIREMETNLLKHHVSTLFKCPRMQFDEVVMALAALVSAVEYCLKEKR